MSPEINHTSNFPIRAVALAISASILATVATQPQSEEKPQVIVTQDPVTGINRSLLVRTSPAARADIAATEALLLPGPSDGTYQHQSHVPLSEKYGVEIREFEPQSLMDNTQDIFMYDPDKIRATSFEQIFQDTKKFALGYGVRLVLAECGSKPKLAYGGQCVSKDTLQTPTAKNNLLVIGSALATIPVELPDAIDLKNITLASNLEFKGKYSHNVAAYSDSYDTIVVDIHDVQTRSVIYHEMSHKVENASAAQAQERNIPSFSALNTNTIYRNSYDISLTSSKSPYPDRKTLHEFPEYNALADAQWSARLKNDKKSWSIATDKLAALDSQVETLDPYSGTYPAEDFANVGATLLGSTSPNKVLDTASPVLRQKAIVYLTRLRLLSPDTVAYLTAGYRQHHPINPREFRAISPDETGAKKLPDIGGAGSILRGQQYAGFDVSK